MRWRRAPGRKAGPVLFSTRPAGVWAGAALVLLAGGAGAVLCSLLRPLPPAVSSVSCAVGAILAMFVATFALVHLFHRVEPIALAKTVYLLMFLLLAGFFLAAVVLDLPVFPGGAPGPVLALLIAGLGAVLPLLLVLLAIGDKGPPVDETRLGHPPRL